jgi:hypothetical protein
MDAKTLIIFRIVIRIIAIIICVQRARKLNRSQFGWGFFGFVFPIPAVIWIYCLKVNKKWIENPPTTNSSDGKASTKCHSSNDEYDKELGRISIGFVLLTMIVAVLFGGCKYFGIL